MYTIREIIKMHIKTECQTIFHLNTIKKIHNTLSFTIMKKLILSIFILGLLANMSCSEDTAVAPAPKTQSANQATLNEQVFSLSSGAIIERGFHENHYKYDFLLSDAIIDANDYGNQSKILVLVEIVAITNELAKSMVKPAPVTVDPYNADVPGKSYTGVAYVKTD